MKKLNNLKRAAFGTLVLCLLGNASMAQVGIGTETPQAKLHLDDGSALFSNEKPDPADNPFYDPAAPEPTHYRLKWFHDKGAFRVLNEQIINQGFDLSKIGHFSFGAGFEVTATGKAAFSAGMRTEASGIAATALGSTTVASGNQSFAAGYLAEASGARSFALGTSVSTNGKAGAFVFGDGNGFLANDLNNQMLMRFSGGYKFYSNATSTVGVQLPPNGNSWFIISDVNKKENFAPVNGEAFLQKISKMNLTSWNYKGQDPKEFRHYGPMAQDFYAAFGKDAYGTIGNDTTINQADFDGVNLIAIQALVKRTEHLEQQNRSLQAELLKLKTQIAGTGPRVKTKDKREAGLPK